MVLEHGAPVMNQVMFPKVENARSDFVLGSFYLGWGRLKLQAVPFWIVEGSREIAEREKKNWRERVEDSLGRVRKKEKGKERDSCLLLLAPVSLRCERTLSTDQKGTACSLGSTRKSS